MLLPLLLLLPQRLAAQRERQTEAGLVLSLAAERELRRNLTLGFEEELRLIVASKALRRTDATLGIDYTFRDRRLKIGAAYAFIYLFNEAHVYESRHRFLLNLSYRQALEPFSFSWRVRLQETLRNEARGSYRVNPRYVMKNKLELAYAVWGKPWKPFLSCDFSTNLNDPETRYDLVRLRFQAGAAWRINRTTSLELFLRWDEYLKTPDPRLLSLGLAGKL